MPRDPVTTLARRHCLVHAHNPRWNGECECERLAAAVREALEEAEKAIIELEFVTHDDPFSRWTTKGGSFAKQAVAAIAALRGGTQ